jgi:hypothetical protein
MINWDYNLPKNWKPTKDTEWQWFLVRKINYDEWHGITKDQLIKYFPIIKNELDRGKRLMLENYLQKYG